MISVPEGTDDISSIWYHTSYDDICLQHMKKRILYHAFCKACSHIAVGDIFIFAKVFCASSASLYTFQQSMHLNPSALFLVKQWMALGGYSSKWNEPGGIPNILIFNFLSKLWGSFHVPIESERIVYNHGERWRDIYHAINFLYRSPQ